MISFDPVVGILLGDLTRGGQRFIEHSRIPRSPVGGHFGRAWAVVERMGEESAGGREISFLCDEDVNDLAKLVDRPVQTDPPPGDFDGWVRRTARWLWCRSFSVRPPAEPVMLIFT